MAKMESHDVRLTSQIPSDATIIHGLSPLLTNFSPDNVLPGEKLSAESLSAIIQRLNRAIVNSDIIWELGSTVVLGISPESVMKAGCGIDIDHIPTMNHIKQRLPQLRSPDIHGILQSGRWGFVFMTRIEGEPLDRLWKTLSPAQKESIKEQLGSMFSSIRSLPPPPSDEPHAILGGGIPRRCKDARRDIRVAEHPIKNVAEFNQFLTSDPKRTETGWLRMIRSFLISDYKLVMTHGDLHPRNVMELKPNVSPSDVPADWVEVTGLLDWEMCGYYSEYWEYVKALHTICLGGGFDGWWVYLPVSIGVWPKEYAVDQLISRRWRG